MFFFRDFQLFCSSKGNQTGSWDFLGFFMVFGVVFQWFSVFLFGRFFDIVLTVLVHFLRCFSGLNNL